MSRSAEASSEIRNYDRSDVDRIVDFYSRAYDGDKDRRLQAFRWIHEENPLADSDFPYLLVVRDGQVVGYWGRMPARLFVQGTSLPIVYSQEALVDPLCRGQGIGQQLAAKACDIGRCMLSLWHNEKIVPVLCKTGWTHVGSFRPWRKTYRWSRVAPHPLFGLSPKDGRTVARWWARLDEPFRKFLDAEEYRHIESSRV